EFRGVLSGRAAIWKCWRASIWRREGSNWGVGKAWISLDSLVRIETFQRVTGDFLRKFFCTPFRVKRSGGRRSSRAIRVTVHTVFPIGQLDIPGVRVLDFVSFNPGVLRQSRSLDHEAVSVFWQEIVGNSDSQIEGDGAASHRATH